MTGQETQDWLGFVGPETGPETGPEIGPEIGPATGPSLDRAAHLRARPETLARLAEDPAARFLVFAGGQVLMAAEGAAADPLLGPGLAVLRVGAAVPGLSAPIFLGLVGECPVFALDLPADLSRPDLWPAGCDFADLRRMMPRLRPLAANLAATARGLIVWHASHGFCPRCGQPTQPTHAGWQRHCPGCAQPQFPRIDPVVIMRITHGDRVLLARSPGWPEGMVSCPAGFMEPGETPAAAVRREVMEETGVRVGAVQFLGAQPWPFPASLMLACAGEALSEDITPDPVEIEAALWVSRARLRAVLDGTDPELHPARKGSVARWMLSRWLATGD